MIMNEIKKIRHPEKIHKKEQYTYKICKATPEKHKKTNLQEKNVNFQTNLNQKRIQQMNLRD